MGIGKYFAHRVPGADITDRIRARGLADRRLVHKHHVGQLLGTQHAVVLTGRLGGAAKVAHQGRRQHVLDQRGLARAADAGHTHQALQRYLDRDVFQVVFAHALQQQARCVFRNQALEAHADLFASAQVSAGQRIGIAQILRRSVEHDLAAAFTRSGAHVQHAVGRQHHGRVVLHHHQRIARVTQPRHGFDDAVHIARMQAYAGLVQHKQRVDQRGAECGREVDALYLAARQGAALAVQAQVTNAHVAQILETGRDFLEQQLQGLVVAIGRCGHTGQVGLRGHQVKEAPQPVYR